MDSSVACTVPPAMSLSASVLFFLNHNLNTGEALSQAPSLVSELQAQCGDLDQNLIDLNRNLGEILVAYSSFSDQTHALFADINAQLIGLLSSTSSPGSASAGSVFFWYIYMYICRCLCIMSVEFFFIRIRFVEF